MVEKLAEIMSDFPGEANRARCLAHIVNLVAKIILRQFDKSKKKKKKNVLPEKPTGNVANETENNDEKELEDLGDEYDDEEERVLDKEEKEMDEGNDDERKDDDSDIDFVKLARDIEIIEEAMEEEIEGAAGEVKPVRQVLYKVRIHPTLVISLGFRSNPFFFTFLLFFKRSFLFFFYFSSFF
jgi:hypothetical protein